MDFLEDLDETLAIAARQADADSSRDDTAMEDEKAPIDNAAVAAANRGDGDHADQDIAAAGQKIKVTVQAQGRADVIFEVSSDKKILKLMTAYAKAMNCKMDGLRFFNMDNERLHKFDTYKEKNIQDGDILEVRMEQEGGFA